MFKKTKNLIKKFKKVIIGFLVGGTALAAGLSAINPNSLQEITGNDIRERNRHINVFQDLNNNIYEIIITKEEYDNLGKKGATAPQYNGYKYLYSASYVLVLNDNEFFILNKEYLETDILIKQDGLVRKIKQSELNLLK